MAKLSGMKQICNYYNRSEATIIALHRDYDFPIVMLLGSWESDTELIDQWRIDTLRKELGLPAEVKEETGVKKKGKK
ncbi:MAG: hypothetical protein M0P69_06055 [Bacteroidales bacterium]|nr:hypothetical protein [Bacteroidales bacterium]